VEGLRPQRRRASFEVPEKCSPEKAKAAWAEYKEAMGVTPERIEEMKRALEAERDEDSADRKS
jgi:hypothetical protein